MTAERALDVLVRASPLAPTGEPWTLADAETLIALSHLLARAAPAFAPQRLTSPHLRLVPRRAA